MRAITRFVFSLLVTCMITTNAMAGIYTDDMSRCLVSSTTSKDKTDLIRWIFGVMAAHPDVASMASIKDKQRDELNRTAGLLMQRLLTEDCRKQTADAIKYEGSGAIQASFGVLGQVAMQELMTNPVVAKNTGEIAKYLDEAKFKELMAPSKEAPEKAQPGK